MFVPTKTATLFMKKLSFLFLFYTVLSWVLFFRDERAISVITTNFYPNLYYPLYAIRSTLLSWHLNTIPTLLFAGFLVLTFWIYFKELRTKVTVKSALFLGILFQAIVFFSYPVLSTDVLSYILSDRIATVYHQNVWATRPDNFKTDPFFGLADWTDQTRIYGGVNQIFYTWPTKLAGNDFLLNLAVHKLVVFCFVVATMIIIAKIAPHFLIVIFANPLFVIETAGSGHNDILMLFFALAGYWLYTKNKYLLSGIVLSLSAHVKVTAIFLVVFLVLELISKLKLKNLATFTIGFVIVFFGTYYFMDVNPLYSLSRTAGSINVFWQSLPMQFNTFVPNFSPLLTISLLVFLLVQTLRVLFFRLHPIEMYVQTLMVYLLFFLAAYWNWYPIWLLVFTPFISKHLQQLVLGLTVSSMLAYVFYWTSLRFDYQLGAWPVIMYVVILFGPCVALFYRRD